MDPTLTGPYEYEPLCKKQCEIRLLIVHAASESPDRIVKGSIRHVSLSTDPKPTYETISYVWGDPRERATILINGARLDCSSSSERALRRMRHATKDRVLWIDAVCINQIDDVERSEQVAIMAKIYANTTTNLVWLGEEEDSTNDALEAVRLIFEDARRETNDFADFLQTMWDHKQRYWRYAEKDIDVDVGTLLECLRFFDNTWFQRLWVRERDATITVGQP